VLQDCLGGHFCFFATVDSCMLQSLKRMNVAARFYQVKQVCSSTLIHENWRSSHEKKAVSKHFSAIYSPYMQPILKMAQSKHVPAAP
jgi:hypothetical protein